MPRFLRAVLACSLHAAWLGGCRDEAQAVEGENPRFLPAGGTFTTSVVVTLDAEPDDAEIHYTLDGSAPTAASPTYLEPIELDTTTTVRAVIVEDGLPVSLPVSHVYLELAADAAAFDSNLPLVVVHMRGGPAPDPQSTEYVDATILTFEAGEPGSGSARSHLLGEATLDGRAGIKVRGSSTRDQPKHSYTLELRDDGGDDLPRPLLGMPADSDWILLAPYSFDRSMVRDALIFRLSREIGRWAPSTRFAEVFLVTDDQPLSAESYVGVYVVAEKIGLAPERIDAPELAPTDVAPPEVTGAYLVKLDRPGPGEDGFQAGGSEAFEYGLVWVDPEETEIAPAQESFLVEHIDAFAAAIATPDGTAPGDGRHYRELIDVDAWIDHHILNTLAKNPDALRLSSFMWKDRQGPLFAGPVWDFDRTMGSYDGRDQEPTGWNPSGDGTDFFGYGWWGDLFAHDDFRTRYVERLQDLLAGPLGVDPILEAVRELGGALDEAQVRNFERWPEVAPRDGSHRAELDDLEAWLTARVAWMSDASLP